MAPKVLFSGIILILASYIFWYLFGTCTILRKCLIMYNVYWDNSWVESDKRFSYIILDYQHCLPLLSITLTVAWQLLLVSCNAKIIKPTCFNSSCKGAHGALHKRLYWEFWGKSQLRLDYILRPFDVYHDLLRNSFSQLILLNYLLDSSQIDVLWP